MTGPQVEDGYTRIANELFDAILAFDFSKRELKVLMAVIRKTYGYGKKSDDLSLGQLHEITGIDVAHLSRTVRDLSAKKVLLIRQGQYAQNIGLNKRYVEWKPLLKQQPPIAETATCQNSKEGVAETAKKPLPKQQPQKTTQKKTPKEKGYVIPEWVDSEAWAEWEQHRKEIGKRLTPKSIEKQIKLLAQFPSRQREIIEQSINAGWQGLFAPKGGSNGTIQPRETAFERGKRKRAELERELALAEGDSSLGSDAGNVRKFLV